jgi:GNAT superfamily N-acetyltransferase
VQAVPVRPMEQRDIDDVFGVSVAAFDDLARRLGKPEDPPAAIGGARIRIGRLLGTDPGGAWVAERDGAVVGAALAIVREGVWGLSLLIVRPEAQSDGLGRELLARAWDHGRDARGWIVLSSADPRALRSYARLGLHLHPAMAARGRPRSVAPDPGVRPGSADDLPLTETVDRAVRGAAHGGDILALLAAGGRMLVLPGRGYAVMRGDDVRLLAALDEDAAAALLRTCFATADGEVTITFITGAQQWVVAPCLDAGLELHGYGAVFLAGDVGPFAPYLPSGAYL